MIADLLWFVPGLILKPVLRPLNEMLEAMANGADEEVRRMSAQLQEM